MAPEEKDVKLLSDLEHALFVGRCALEYNESLKRQIAELGNKLKEMEALKDKFKDELLNVNLELSAYIRKFGNLFTLCPHCMGAGGYPSDVDEVGSPCGWEDCDLCKGTGIVDRPEGTIVKCLTCGVEFDLIKAKWCEHEPTCTKVCPNGHCICEFYKEHSEKFRPANELESKFGFSFMLDKEEGGVVGKNGNKM